MMRHSTREGETKQGDKGVRNPCAVILDLSEWGLESGEKKKKKTTVGSVLQEKKGIGAPSHPL